MRRALWFPVAAMALAAPAAQAQYFGTNLVQYKAFDWQFLRTDHFDVYYYGDIQVAAMDAARMAERGYARLSRILNHQFRERKPIILYASHSDFQQTTVPVPTPEGTQGVTEFFRHRMVLPFTGSYAEFDHVLQHEMVHQFQFDVYSRGRAGAGLTTLMAVNPPGWFMEGMAEYLSVGPLDAMTGMWLRDAAVEGQLPTADQLASDAVFPYRFGHALWYYIGWRWGDAVVGDILASSATVGIQGALRQTLGLTFEELVDDWRDKIQVTVLPQVTEHYRARRLARPVLNQKRTGGVYRLAPALSPDGSEIAFFSARDLFVDLWLADAATGRVTKRLIKSTVSSNFESLRFISSSVSWSPDGTTIVFAAKRGPRDDIVLHNVRRGKRWRVEVAVDGVLTPSFAPDAKRVVFTGLQHGISDLYVVDLETGELSRLTHDAFAELHPVWSPDGASIAFATDRGREADPSLLRYGNLGIALYHLASGRLELLDHMDRGTNVNPQWSPDGKSIAFVSDRTGIGNVFLYELESRELYQLSDVYTGIAGITETSPAITWAREADRIAFLYFEAGDYNVYGVDNPRSLKKTPYDDTRPPVVAIRFEPEPWSSQLEPRAASLAVTPLEAPRQTASIYRAGSTFRASSSDPTPSVEPSPDATVSVAALLDSAELALPDTGGFTRLPYKVRFSPDYLARPQLGYQRDNFGRGFYGGTAIQLSDLLAQHHLTFSAEVNGRIDEARAYAAYANLARRINWTVGISQDPVYNYLGGTLPVQLEDGSYEASTVLIRSIVRQGFAFASRPFSRFRRFEAGMRLANISQDIQQYTDHYNPLGQYHGSEVVTLDGPEVNYVQPSVALVFDNALTGWTGPFMGRRSRLELAPAFGDWEFLQILGDYRRYDRLLGPFTFATRVVFFGRRGRDADAFPLFLGNTELIRGYTSGSFQRSECTANLDPAGTNNCVEFDQLVGSQLGVANAELRFPLTRTLALGFLPVWLPPIEAALFYDLGIAFNSNSVIKWERKPSDPGSLVREPVASYGLSFRANLLGFLIMRADYANPVDRAARDAFWTISFGPSF